MRVRIQFPLLLCAVAFSLQAVVADRLKVLLVEGLSNHDWEHRIPILESILSKEGSFDLDVTVAPDGAGDPGWATWHPVFSDYDVVISGYRSPAGGPGWPEAVKTDFTNYVAGGGGFVAFHEANQSFPDWPEYQEIIGLGWTDGSTGTAMAVNPGETFEVFGPGEGSYTGHGNRADSLVTRLGSHPIHAGLPLSWMAADLEVVRYARGPAQNLTVLSYAPDPDPEAGQPAKNWPIEWTVGYGSGRVYASTYGHLWSDQAEPVGMRCVAFQETLVRALKWCAGEDPGTTVPADFPSDTAISLRPHTEGLAGFGGAQPIGPFANGVLPSSSVVPSGIDVVPAFPNLSWDSPIDARPWPGDPGQMMVAEMDGRIFKLADDDATTTRQLVLDARDRVWYMNWDSGAPNTKHGGILSCAFHPRFGTGEGKDYLFVYYIQRDGDDPDALPPYYQRLSRFTWTGSSFDPASEFILIQQYDTVKGHDGGSLVFGPDGFLYLPFGDEGTAGEDADGHTQKIDDRPRSGVWRIDVDQQGGAVSHAPIRGLPTEKHDIYGNYQPGTSSGSFTQGYFIPNDNPWVDPTGNTLEEFYAIGLRQPHRMSYDPVGGRFWIGDVGANSREEVDVMDAPALNFQWNYLEGITGPSFRPTPSPLIGTERGPVHEYDHGTGTCVIGGYVYHGSAIPELAGKYIFGDNGTQLIYALDYDEATGVALSVEQIGQARPGIIWTGLASFGIDSSGELLTLQMGAGQPGGGLISRIKPGGTASEDEWQYPALLSETGLFTDLPTLTPAPGVIPYEVNSRLWTAGVGKRRWIVLPNDGVPDTADERLVYSENGSWEFPVGTVLVKHFERPDNGAPLETRLLVHGVDGWGGVTYKWRPDGLEADRLEGGLVEDLTIGGETFDYLYPARNQCLLCHTDTAGSVLGFRTRQINSRMTYSNGVEANQIESLSSAGFIPEVIKEEDLAGVVTSVPLDDASSPVELRVRSYLDSNCSHCHQPGGGSRAFFDARLTTPLPNQGLLCGPVIETLGLPAPAVVKPGSLENSVMFQRMNTVDECCQMPPVAKGRIDQDAVVEVAEWILGMTPDSCDKAQSFLDGGQLGSTAGGGTAGADGWNTHLVVDEDAIYTNTTGRTVEVSLDRFRYQALDVAEPLTPFVVRVNGDNDFTVLAVGSTRATHAIGTNEAAFADAGAAVVLKPGESLAAGFLDAWPDGTGGTAAEVVPWTSGGPEIWHGGSMTTNCTVSPGSPPSGGELLQTGQFRDYDFAIDYTVTGLRIGNDLDLAGFRQVDGATSNFAINLSDTFTNTGATTMSVSVDRFLFETLRVTDPLTPFVVRVNGPDDFTVLAVGSSQTSYVTGANDVAFGAGTTLVTVAPGETVAAGFVDSFPDGTGGSDAGAMAFVDGGDSIFYRYHYPDHVGATLELGQSPDVPHPYGSGTGPRSYLFSVTLGFGGPEDEDGDGLPDSWELAFVPTLGKLGATGDRDGDGSSDAEEFANGTNPDDPGSVMKALRLDPAGGGPLAEFTSVPGHRYRIDVTSDFGGWLNLGEFAAADWPATTTAVVLPVGGLPAGGDRRLFFRVEHLSP